MIKPSRSFPYILFFLISSIAGVLTMGRLVSIPSDPKNEILLGFSPERLLLLVILLVFITGFLYLSHQSARSPGKVETSLLNLRGRNRLFISLVCLLIFASLLFWILAHLPPETVRPYQAYIERIKPLLIYFSFLCLQMGFGMLFLSHQDQPDRLKKILPNPKPFLYSVITVFSSLLALWAIVALTGYGVWPGNAFWGKLGVPITGFQLIAAYLLGIGFFVLLGSGKLPSANYLSNIRMDLLLSALIVGIAILIWSNQPAGSGKFLSEPKAPNFAQYPDSDSAVYDRSAQSILMGFPMRGAIDKPLYVAYLAALNFFSGSDYNTLIMIQFVLMAFIPVMLYWLGRALHSRPLGLMIAVISIMKESNAIITTNLLQVSNVRMILTEMATMALVLLFTLVFVRWLKKPIPNNPALWFAGGTLGIAAMFRLNILAAIPFLLLAIGWVHHFKLKQWTASAFLLVFFTLVSLSPWIIRNGIVLGNPWASIMTKTQGVIISNRYMPVLTEELPDDSSYLIHEDEFQDIMKDETNLFPIHRYIYLGEKILDHYIHNLVGITFMLPPTPVMYELTQLIRLPYWDIQWNGNLEAGSRTSLLVSLGLISLGIGSAYSRKGVAGIAPLFVVLGYNLANALSLTSGGRYLVPVDWAALLYFAIGLMEVTFWAAAILGLKVTGLLVVENLVGYGVPKSIHLSRQVMISGLLFLGLFSGLGAVPALIEVSTPPLYPSDSPSQEMVAHYKSLIESHVNMDTPDQFAYLSSDQAVWLVGRALYPRFFAADEYDLERFDPLRGPFVFSRITFQLLNSDEIHVILPIEGVPAYFPNAADVVVVGCHQDKFFEAMAVIVQGQEQLVYIGSNQVPSGCFLIE